MLDHFASAHLAVDSARLVALSARPDAPVVATRERARLDTRARAGIAAGLHRVATALEPRPVRSTSPACR